MSRGAMPAMRVGIVSRTATYWPLFVMAREDATLQLVELGSTAAGVDALLERRVDVAATCPDVLIMRNAPLRIAAGLVDRPPTTLVARRGIDAFEELRGCRVAVTQERGSVSVFLRALLRRHGLASNDYTQIICGPTPAQAQALRRGAVDAAMLTSPFDDWLVAQGFVALASVGDELGPCAFTTLNVRPHYSATPDWRAFIDRLVRTAELLGDAVTMRVLAEETGTRVRAPGPLRIGYDARVDVAAVERLIGFMREDGIEVAAAAETCLDDGARTH